ncbi:MAG: hypothetical protein Q9218_003200 [Villophora microphyllina]
MPITRRAARIRLDQGILPSPQSDLPRELGGTQRRKKKETRSTRATVTPESDGDLAARPNQDISAHALREGNAGGYVESAPSTRSIREQQDSLPVLETHDMASRTSNTVAPSHQSGFEAAAAAVGIFRGSPPVARFIPPEIIHTPPHSPTFVPSSITQTVRDTPPLVDDQAAQSGASHVQSTVEQPTQAQPVSPKTDGQKAAVVSPTTVCHSSSQTKASPITTDNTSSQKRASPITMRDASTSTETTSRDISVQTTVSANSFRPMGLYGFRSELALPPRICSLTIHLGHDKEVRISNVPAEAMHELAGILHNHHSLFERNWLTHSEEAAAAAAAQNPPPSATKRKREEQVDNPQSAQRRRIEVEPEPEPESTPTPTPPNQSLRKGSRRLRQMALKNPRPNTSQWQPASIDTIVLTGDDTTAQYSRTGELRLLGPAPDYSQNDNIDSGSPVRGGAAAAKLKGAEYGSSTEGLSSAQATSQTSQTQTPEPSSWRLGSFFNTAKRFIPGIRREANPIPAPQTIRPSAHTELSNDSNMDALQRVAQTEPRRQDQRSMQVNTEARSNFAQRLRDSQESSKKSFRNKESVAELRKLRAEKERIRAEWAELEEERRVTEQEKKDVEEAHRAVYAAQKTGSKRPAISPRVIPNPPGVSYGLDSAYFDYSSSEDEDEEEASPSAKQPPLKVRRTQGPDTPQTDKSKNMRGNAGISTDYDATKTPNNEALHYSGSRFSDSPPNVFDRSQARSSEGNRGPRRQEFLKELVNADGTVFRLSDPGFNHSGHFEVPWSPDSSDEDEEENSTQETPIQEQSLSPSFAQQVRNSQDQDRAAAISASAGSSTQTMQPTTVPVTEQPSLATILQSAAASATVTQPFATPAPKQAPPVTAMGRNAEASKTLERNRQMLRAQLAEKSGRSVLSPKDILASPTKGSLPSESVRTSFSQPANPARAFEIQSRNGAAGGQTGSSLFTASEDKGLQTTNILGSSTQPQERDEFSILGAAGRASPESPELPKSPGRILAETLPSIHNRVSGLKAYSEYEQTMDPKVKEVLEAAWAAGDEEASSSAFRTPFTAFVSSQQAEASLQAKQPSLQSQQQGPSADDGSDDHDDALFYGNDTPKGNKAPEGAVAVMKMTGMNFNSNYQMDPSVAAYLESQWTPEDEAYASGEFKGDYAGHKRGEAARSAWMAAEDARA